MGLLSGTFVNNSAEELRKGKHSQKRAFLWKCSYVKETSYVQKHSLEIMLVTVK